MAQGSDAQSGQSYGAHGGNQGGGRDQPKTSGQGNDHVAEQKRREQTDNDQHPSDSIKAADAGKQAEDRDR